MTDIQTDIQTDILLTDFLEAGKKLTEFMTERMKELIPDGYELPLNIYGPTRNMEFPTAFEDNSTRAPYPEWWDVPVKTIRNINGRLEYSGFTQAGTETGFTSLERDGSLLRDMSIISIYNRVDSLRKECVMDDMKYELQKTPQK